MFQEQAGKQLGALERSPFVSSGTHRMGDPQGYGTDGTGAHWRGRSLPAETTGDASKACFPTKDIIFVKLKASSVSL